MTINFLNTRPVIRASHLTEVLTAKGIAVRELPLLELIPCVLSANERSYFDIIDSYDVVVCVSPTAVENLLSYLQDYQQKEQVWLAVGESTQRVLAEQGIKAQAPSDFELEKSNEGMLQMPAIQQLTENNRVLILRGHGGRRLLVTELQQSGVQVDSVALYKRERPLALESAYQEIKTWARVVLISSGEAWQHWLSVCDVPNNYGYIVLGNRLKKRVLAAQCECVIVNELSATSIYAAILSCS